MCPLAYSMSKNFVVLIIDDAQQNIQVLGNMLEMAGYEVLVATSGPEALEIAQAYPPPDLILLDIMMPGMDGLEALGRILSRDNSIPVILNSAYSSYRDSFMSWSADAYLTKSSDTTELKAKILELLGAA